MIVASSLPVFLDPAPRVCLTAGGILIHQDRVLLVRHKKLGFWLNPGGHLESGELPHQTAEREFFEETGIKVRAVQRGFFPNHTESDVAYTPIPIVANLHWISQENYLARTRGERVSAQTQADWGQRGCEQHYGQLFLVEPIVGVELQHDPAEVTDIAWFSESEVADLETKNSIKHEVAEAFKVWRN